MWEDPFDLLPQIDTCILGRRDVSRLQADWGAILANPEDVLPFTDKVATKGEIAYTRFGEGTPHVVCPGPWTPSAGRTHGSIVRDIEEIRRVKQQPGKDCVPSAARRWLAV